MSWRLPFTVLALSTGLALSSFPVVAQPSSSEEYRVLAKGDIGLSLDTVEKFLKDGDELFLKGNYSQARKKYDKARDMSKLLLGFYGDLSNSFKGVDAIQQAIDNRVTITGCTVHYVQKEVDSGSIIIQAAVPIQEHDNKETLTKRIQQMEHIILPLAIAKVAMNIRTGFRGNK